MNVLQIHLENVTVSSGGISALTITGPTVFANGVNLELLMIISPTMDATDLEFIPRAVRDKLDRVAIKLHLAQWQALTLEERRELYEMPCTGSEEIRTFRVRLEVLVWQRYGQRLRRL